MDYTIAHQALLSMEFSRQEYWSGLPFPSPGDLHDSGIDLRSCVSPELAGEFFTTKLPGKTLLRVLWVLKDIICLKSNPMLSKSLLMCFIIKKKMRIRSCKSLLQIRWEGHAWQTSAREHPLSGEEKDQEEWREEPWEGMPFIPPLRASPGR